MSFVSNSLKIDIVIVILFIILILMVYVLFKAENIVTTATFQLDRAELIGKTLLRGCNGTQI